MSQISVKQLRHMAAQERASAHRCVDAGDAEGAFKATRLAELYRLAVAEMERKGLPAVPNSRSLIAMDVQTGQKPRRRGRPTTSTHPFPQALEAKGSNVAEWAEAHKYQRRTVQAWILRNSAPRAAAEAIERELGLPATEETWKHGVR